MEDLVFALEAPDCVEVFERAAAGANIAVAQAMGFDLNFKVGKT